MTGPVPGRPFLPRLGFAVLGAALLLLVFFAFQRRLLVFGYPSPLAFHFALVLATALELLWLPLLALGVADRERAGVLETVLIWLGALFAGAGIVIAADWNSPARAAGPGTASGAGTGISAVLWSQAIAVSVAMAVGALARLAAAWGARPTVGRLLGVLALGVLLTSPFWSRAIIDGIDQPAGKSLATHASVWLAPMACLSTAFEGFNFATLGRFYRIWLGPVVPYPTHPGLVVAAYAVLAALLHVIAALAPGESRRPAGTEVRSL